MQPTHESIGVFYQDTCRQYQGRLDGLVRTQVDTPAPPTSIDISRTALGTGATFDAFLAALGRCHDLTTLVADATALSTRNLRDLCDVLMSSCPQLQSLSLRNCHFYVEAGEILARFARRHRPLVHVDVSDNPDLPIKWKREIDRQIHLNAKEKHLEPIHS